MLVARLRKVEEDFEHFRRGWDTHLPTILDALARNSREAGLSEEAHLRIDTLWRNVDRLALRLDVGLDAMQAKRTEEESETASSPNELRLHLRNGDAVLKGFVDVDLSATESLPPYDGTATQIVIGVGVDIGSDDKASARLLSWVFGALAPRGVVEIHRRSIEDVLSAVERGVLSARQAKRLANGDLPLSAADPGGAALKASMQALGFNDVRTAPVKSGVGILLTATRASAGLAS